MLNPLDWPSPVFVMFMVAAIVLRILLPWRGRISVRVAQEVLVFLPAVLLYFLVRGIVDSSEATAVRHGKQIISLEQRLGIWWEPDLQQAILGSNWRADVVNWVYIWGHWPVIALVVTWLVLRHFDHYPKYRNALLISGVIGMVIFATYPLAPPRLMPGYGLVDTVTLRSNSYRVLQPPALTHPNAAMPSLHFGWNLLMGIALVRESRKLPLRILGCLIPIAMLLAIVLSANHYILDAAAGGIIVLFSLAISTPVTTFMTRIALSIRNRIWPEYLIDRKDDPALLELPKFAGQRSSMEARGGETGDQFSHNILTNRPFLVAHRYGNTLSGLELAEQAPADIIEVDVWPYHGRLEVRHTKTLGPLPVLWDRWSLERGWKPRLQFADVLKALEPETLLMIDVKGNEPTAAAQIVESLRTHRPDKPVLVCAQNWDQIERFRPYPEVMRVYSIGNRWQLRQAWDQMDAMQWEAISIQLRLLNEQTVRALRARVKIVMTWPVNDRERFDQVTRWGVDGMTSDNLKLIAGLVKRRRSAMATATPQDKVDVSR